MTAIFSQYSEGIKFNRKLDKKSKQFLRNSKQGKSVRVTKRKRVARLITSNLCENPSLPL